MKFWKWFYKNDELIRKILTRGTSAQKEKLSEHFDNYILDLGKFSWEVIQEENERFSFVISPNRNKDFFSQTQQIISEAPKLEFWSFFPAKKANKELASFELYDKEINRQFFDPKNWLVSKEKTTSGKYNISVYSSDFDQIDMQTSQFAAEIAIASYIGEAQYMEQVSNIEVALKKKEMVSLKDF